MALNLLALFSLRVRRPDAFCGKTASRDFDKYRRRRKQKTGLPVAHRLLQELDTIF